MRTTIRRILPVFLLPFSVSGETQLMHDKDSWRLQRDGQPYLIKGGGGEILLDELVAAGGNSIRLWGDDHLGEKLDEAQRLGLTVTAGIWLGQVRQGFDWSDADGLIKQREHVAATVSKYKDHPALLMWALGNEMEDAEGSNGAVWTAINSLAVMVRQIDPAHPTMTVIAEIGGTKPYVLTEFGPPGIWECGKDAIGAFAELSSTAKAEKYREAYTAAVLGEAGLSLGAYAFLWGNKQEVTPTWFSMFLPDGSRLAAVDTMAELWRGEPVANPCPQIVSLSISGERHVKPGTHLQAVLDTSDPDSDPLSVAWSLVRDPEEYGTGGDTEDSLPAYPQALLKSDRSGAEIVLPEDGGLYRLCVTVRDGNGGAAVANVPVRVDAPVKIAYAAVAKLPLDVYAEAGDPPSFVPGGWMGDAGAIAIDPAWAADPKAGKKGLRCAFNAPQGWGGVVWQNPEGDRAGGFDLSGAQRLSFWARGEKGGEVVSFSFGLIAAPKRFTDSATGSLEGVVLTDGWRRYEIPCEGLDLRRIKTGFAWTLAASGEPVVFYLDEVRWE